MKNQIILNKKTFTKLLNASFRQKILDSYKKDTHGIVDYAKYVVDSQIIQRMQGYENDAKAGWGFPQLNILCCIRKNGTIDKKFFEFNSVNHFLKDKDGDTAVDVVKCILILWLRNEKSTIESFDYEKIDAELVRIDKEIADKKAKDEKINATGSRIKDIVKPVIESARGKEYSVISEDTKNKVEKLLEEFKKAGQIVQYVVSLDRNIKQSIEKHIFFIDIGFKIEEADDYTILACNIIPEQLNKNEQEEKEKQEENIKGFKNPNVRQFGTQA